MKSWLSKIDFLFVFLCLSLLTLFSFVNDFNYFFPKTSEDGFKDYIDYKNVFEFPEQGVVSEQNKLINFNSSYDLLYSTNGGDSYQRYQNENIIELKSNDITTEITSIRYKKPFGYLPTVTSILVKAKHKVSNRFTKPKQITYFNKLDSNLPIVNLVVKESDLFDESDGIMTLGEHSWFDNGFYKPFWERNANYKLRGKASQKSVYFQLFQRDVLQYESQCGIQISGNATRSFPQKSLKIKASKLYQKDKLDYPFFGDTGLKKYKSLVLRNSGNDNTKTLFADMLMHQLASEFPVMTQKGKLVNVFLNGNYWGIYNLRERYDNYFIAKKEDVKASKVTILEGELGELRDGDEVEQKLYVSFVDSIYAVPKVDDKLLAMISKKIDLESFTYYVLLECYYGNGDWLNNNVLWYKAGKKKWKWILNDLDYGLAYTGSNNVKVNYFKTLEESNSITAKLYKALMKNENYKQDFKVHAKLMFDLMNDTDKVFNELKTEIAQNINWHCNRWRGNFDKIEWEQNCESNLEFLQNRKDYFLKYVEEL